MTRGPTATVAALAASLGLLDARAPDRIPFVDATADSRITFAHVFSPEKRYILESMSGGVALFDADRDGRLDVYLVNAPTVASAGDPRSARSELWRNRGDGTFEDVTDRAGVGYPGWGMGAVAADVDNDGWTDLYVTCYGPNRLYRNNGDGTFSEIAERAGVADARWSTGAAWADYDRDGWLDLFVANYADVRLDALPPFGGGRSCEFHGIPVQCGPRGLPGSGDSLYRNRRDGTFEEVSAKAGVADPAGRFGMGAVWSDFDDDGFPELFVANDAGPNFLYRNEGDGTFVDVALQAGTAFDEDGREQGSMGVAVGDFDRSGGRSLFVTNFAGEYNALYRRERGLRFVDASFASRTAAAGLPHVGWGAHFLDYDNDGWLDLLVVNGHVYPQVERHRPGAQYAQPRLLYRNNGDGTFTNLADAAGPAVNARSVGRGSAAGDLDDDGDLDVVVNNLDGAPTVLRNDVGQDANFLRVELEGRTTTRSAIGAIVTVRAGELVLRAERRAGGSYLSTDDGRLHFGLGGRAAVDSVEVRWPNGTVQSVDRVPANLEIRIVEGEAVPARRQPARRAGVQLATTGTGTRNIPSPAATAGR